MKISKKIICSTITIAFFYFLLVIYIQNSSLINSTVTDGTGLAYKFSLFTALIVGFITTMTIIECILFVITGLLIGINLTLIMQRVKNVKRTSKGQLFAGSSSLVGVFGGGCASCGLPILSFLGSSGAVLYLPFKGAELPYISITLLLVSFYFLVNDNNKKCKIDRKKRLSVVPVLK